MALSADQRGAWDRDGFLILPGFYDAAEVDAVLSVHERVWRERPQSIVVDNLVEGGRTRISQTEDGAEHVAHKVNDLYLEYEAVRECALGDRLAPILEELIGDAPALCNSLNLDYGTQQEPHVDSLYMTPPESSSLIATWIALEDCHPDAGPLLYVPGSHRIPPYRFSDGRVTEIASERALWRQYVQEEVANRDLEEREFLPKRGDLLIWHGQLLHGGGKRNDPRRTRRSLVCHYFTAQASRAAGYALVPEQGGGYWIRRPHQASSAGTRAAHLGGRALRQLKERLLPTQQR